MRGLAGSWGPCGMGVLLALVGQPVLWQSQVGPKPDAGSVTGGVLIAVAALPLGGLHRWPTGALAVSAAGLFAYGALGFPASPADLATLFLLAWVVGVSRPAVSLTAPVLVVGASGMTALLRPGVHSVGYVAGGLLAPVLATLVGVAGREHKQRSEAARHEQEAALAAHRLAVDQAAATERLRIAREMHDAIGHGVTVATLAAEAASKLGRRDPDRADEFLEIVVRTGKQTMQELHQLLGLLCSEPDNRAARPAETLDEVVRRYANAGLEASLKVGNDCPALPAHVERAITAIVAEGLANTVRHSGAHRAVVELDWEDGLLHVTVTDDGRGPGSAEFSFGLTGAAERARSLGGRLHLEASPTGGSRLEAAIPYTNPVGHHTVTKTTP